MREGYTCQCLTYLHLLERFKMWFETLFEIELYTNDEYVVAKMYNLKFETEKEMKIVW